MLIDRKDFERWADTPEAKSGLAELVYQMVMNSLPNDGGSYNIPIGSATFLGGWDGFVDSTSTHHFIPQGRSGWEFGVRNDFKEKANKDYRKRTNEIPDADKSQMSFVFVTPFYWGKKDKWAASKKAEGKWKDVIVYDSVNLAQWIAESPIVTTWFAQRIGLSFDSGVILPNVRWNEISFGRNMVLSPKFYIAGRERLLDDLLRTISGAPCLRAYRASSREEAMGFIIAAGMSLPEPARANFLGKTVVVDSVASLRMMAQCRNNINIITHLEDNRTRLFKAKGSN